ncbi:hypothetical protein JQX13_09400 [Archangium violaceum]|uniref:hypothetical protein n=1 Tax=Archangium violaceum TaxID=83451 RepID=UPI00193B67D7|nr:hypothetical protein [Archangium violaceum]QRK10281.1 hypothetical protein JQX13_09400 [Archangium violaceum]
MRPGNIIYEEREMEDARVELKAEADRLLYLGPNLTLRRCTIVVRVPTRKLFIRSTTFIDCDIELKQELKRFSWTGAALKGCRFTGRMVGCDFGAWPGHGKWWEHGAVEDCDFSETRLDLCRFQSCDPRTLRLPRWPCFTILDPLGRGRELTSASWPGSFSPVTLEGPYKELPTTVALSFYAPAEARRCETTEEELKAAIERFDFIVH